MRRLLSFVVLMAAAACRDGATPFAPPTESASVLTAARTAAVKASKVDVCHVDDMGNYKLINVSANALKAHLGHGDGLPGVNGLGADCSVAVDPFSFVSVGAVDGQIQWTVIGTPSAVTFNIEFFVPPLPGGMGGGVWIVLDETVSGTGPGSYASVELYGTGSYRIVATLSDANVVTSPLIIIP